MQSNECNICCETINKRRTEISCLHCNKKCCSDCFTKQLISSEPVCMFCKNVISDDFIYDNTTKSFSVSYRKHKYEQHFIREKSLLPETQEKAENERNARILDIDIKNNDEEIRKKRNFIRDLKKRLELQDKKEKKITKTQIKNIRNDIYELHEKIYNSNRQIRLLRQIVSKDKTEVKYLRACPDNECRGFLSSAYKCGTCEKYFCSDCHVVKISRVDNDHVCDEDTKASIQMINLDCKPCPKCSSLIYRTEGCSLMWCIKCHTQFDWNTLEIKHGYNHNPEYFRYMRENGNIIPRNQVEVVEVAFDCNMFPEHYVISRRLREHNIHNIAWDEIYRYRFHIIDIVMRKLPMRVEVIDCSDLRVKYLLSELNEEEWKKSYFRKMKQNEINHERYKVLDMYCNVIKDNFLNLMTDCSLMTFLDACNKIEKYTNEQLEKINKKYNSKDKSYFLKCVRV